MVSIFGQEAPNLKIRREDERERAVTWVVIEIPDGCEYFDKEGNKQGGSSIMDNLEDLYDKNNRKMERGEVVGLIQKCGVLVDKDGNKRRLGEALENKGVVGEVGLQGEELIEGVMSQHRSTDLFDAGGNQVPLFDALKG